ncbi:MULTISPECIES: hypothetical protein [Streptomyces]|uniref:Secreted protein n=1 Tax=Streptomyces dengpaensis TaxID=2049881 RepID=A0ABN5IDX4_9ACTN|nr:MULTISPECIES: hypothetical protein [Streptomyces]AVH61276.1 hypothetical protein C4B68_18905 [Streptomyces dengpaensis]PIB04145.1 hypothetical protein B1C81_34460 [Streptomyces sp. HG99]
MDIFVTVLVLLAIVAAGVLLIHLLNNQHDERIAAFHYGRSRSVVRGLAPSAPQMLRGRAVTSGAGDRRDHRDGGRGRLRPRRRTRTAGK